LPICVAPKNHLCFTPVVFPFFTLLGTNTGPGGTRHRVRISGFELWQIGANDLISMSQGHFDSYDYHRQLECGVQKRREKL
jgi:hypothetical protein